MIFRIEKNRTSSKYLAACDRVEARAVIEDCRRDDNHHWPHCKLGYQSPKRFAATQSAQANLDHGEPLDLLKVTAHGKKTAKLSPLAGRLAEKQQQPPKTCAFPRMQIP